MTESSTILENTLIYDKESDLYKIFQNGELIPITGEKAKNMTNTFAPNVLQIDNQAGIQIQSPTGDFIYLTTEGVFRGLNKICSWDEIKLAANKSKEEIKEMAKELIKEETFIQEIINKAIENILVSNDIEVLNAIEKRIKTIKSKRFISIIEEEKEQNNE